MCIFMWTFVFFSILVPTMFDSLGNQFIVDVVLVVVHLVVAMHVVDGRCLATMLSSRLVTSVISLRWNWEHLLLYLVSL